MEALKAINSKRGFDILEKIFLVSIITSFAIFFYNKSYKSLLFSSGTSFVHNDKIFFRSTEIFDLAIIMVMIVLLFFTANTFIKSEYNKTKFEKTIESIFNSCKLFIINEKLYTLFCVVYYSIIMFVAYDLIVLLSASNSMILESNSVTFEPYDNYGYTMDRLFFDKMLVLFSTIALFIFKPRKEVNKAFLLGMVLLPILLSVVPFYDYFFNQSSLNLNLKISDYITDDFKRGSIIGIIAFSLYILIKEKMFVNIQESLYNLGSLFLGYIVNAVVIGAVLIGVINGSSLDYFKNNYNKLDINLPNGEVYTVDQTLLTNDDKVLESSEYLIEAYAGLTMHNAYLVTNKFYNSKISTERTVALISTIMLKNLEIITENKEALLNRINSEKGMDSANMVNIWIQRIIYEATGEERQIPVYQLLVDKKYQEAFDYYIEHLANSTEIIYSTYNKEKSEGAFVLNPYGIEMFAALHSEDLIEIDLSKIKSEKIRGIIEREIMPKVKTDYIINVSDEEEQELEKILEMFNI
tara:strand:+ start:11073 stop:12644 length:1572 start_codon:yes stop_codon:yes gene_type:complete